VIPSLSRHVKAVEFEHLHEVLVANRSDSAPDHRSLRGQKLSQDGFPGCPPSVLLAEACFLHDLFESSECLAFIEKGRHGFTQRLLGLLRGPTEARHVELGANPPRRVRPRGKPLP